MSLTNCEVKTNNIQELPDSPSMSSTELKQIFDKSSKDIKDYLNETLIPEIDKLYDDTKTEIKKLILKTTKYEVVTNADISTSDDYTLPDTYKVNTNGLDIYYEGCLLALNTNYKEVGSGLSNKIRFGWDIKKGSNLTFVIRK